MRKLTTREQLTIDYLPECNWVIKAAGIKAGFSGKYAQHLLPARILSDITLKTAYAAKVAEIREKHIADRAERQRFWSKTMVSAPKIADRLKASELLGRSEADFTDNINQTDTQRQRELDEKEQAEAVRIAEIRLRELKEA